MVIYKNFIGGKWITSDSHKSFKSINPANEQPLGKFPLSNGHDVNLAVKAAQDAWPKWRATPAPIRGAILLKMANLLKANKERLTKLVTLEMGKVLNEAKGDIQEAIDTAEYFAGEGRRLLGHTAPSELPDKFCMTVRQPVGPFAIITPWNFPIAIPSWKAMPALIAGNPIILKPSSDAPLCAIEYVKIMAQAGIPPGIVNLVTGSGGTVGTALVKHPQIRGISFTGHKDTGQFILKEAGLKRVGLELGGKNPIVILDDADLDLALHGVLWGGYATTGQRCTSASRVIVHQKIFKKFERALLRQVEKIKVGSGLDKKSDIGPLVNKAALEKVHKYTEIGLKAGAKLLCGGEPVKGKGFFYKPTLFTDCSPDMRICQEEIFGPTVCLIPVRNFDQAIEAANSIEYGLSSSIYTRNVKSIFKAIKEIEAGLTYVNSPTIGAEVHLPFGGVKHSGNIRETGILGIEEFTETKTVYIDYSGKLQKAQKINHRK